jgi:hypothetical protein
MSLSLVDLLQYRYYQVKIYIVLASTTLKTNTSKFTRGLDPFYGDASSAKSFKVLLLIFWYSLYLINHTRDRKIKK